VIAAIVIVLLPAQPPIVNAQPEPTPILGEPVAVTPLATSINAPAPFPQLPTASENGRSSTITAERAETSPDGCEPNNTPAKACPLPLDAVSGPFTFVPENDQDFFRLDLPQEPSIQTVLTVHATEGLDLVLSARQGETLLASGTISLTLAPSIVGPVILRVENRDPRPSAGEQYRIEVRREIVAPHQSERGDAVDGEPDGLENNWSFETASAVAVGVVYDLSFVCPDFRPDACPGGDHDYLLVPVKAGMTYLFATFDLDPGVDTVLELFWGSTTTAIAGNDDYASSGTLSALTWKAPGDGLLAVRIAPRNGGLHQHVDGTKAGYRFAAAPLASELARKLTATIREQANVPTPTATRAASPAGAPASGGNSSAGGSGSSPINGTTAQENIAAGPAIITRATVLRREPGERSTALAELAPETLVSVRGPVSGLWVSIATEASILPGWVRWSDLQRVAQPATDASATPATTALAPTSQQTGAANDSISSPTASVASPPRNAVGSEAGGREVAVQELDPVLPPPPPVPVVRVPFTLSVVIVATDRPPTGGTSLGFATPTPDLRHPIDQVRVQLVNVFGDVLAEGVTDAQGGVQLRLDIRPGDALAVRIPAWGIEFPLGADQTRLVVTIPEALR
jgi:hypothetical protein